eukprot:scaffold3282_cov385-Prasinococcus_capsulatus_cf.AAC.5
MRSWRRRTAAAPHCPARSPSSRPHPHIPCANCTPPGGQGAAIVCRPAPCRPTQAGALAARPRHPQRRARPLRIARAARRRLRPQPGADRAG